MNKMKEVAKLLGYEVGEEFNVIYNDGVYATHNPFKFIDTDLIDKDGDNNNDVLIYLLTGHYTTEKIPFVPKMGEKFFSYGAGLERPYIEQLVWANICYDRERKLLGIIFKTKQEALNYLPTWLKRLEGESCEKKKN